MKDLILNNYTILPCGSNHATHHLFKQIGKTEPFTIRLCSKLCDDERPVVYVKQAIKEYYGVGVYFVKIIKS